MIQIQVFANVAHAPADCGAIEESLRNFLGDNEFEFKGAFPASLLTRIRSELEAAGEEVVVTDNTIWVPHYRADRDAIEACADPGLKKLKECIVSNPRGQFIVPERARKQVIAVICEVLVARTKVIAKNNERVAQLRNYLYKRFPGAKDSVDEPIRVGTPDKYAFDPSNEITIFDQHAGTLKTIRDSVRLDGTEMRFCVRSPSPLDEASSAWLELLCGPVIFPTHVPPDVEVVFVDTPAQHPPKAKLSALERKRIMLWHNTSRNQAIAGLGAAIRDGDEVWRHNVDLDAMCQKLANRQVAILVESLAHGKALHALLPQWDLISCERQAEGEFVEESWDACEIITETAVQSTGLEHDIVICAGNCSLVNVPDFPSKKQTLVIDFKDDFDLRAVRETDERCAAYQRAGWRVANRQRSPAHA